MSKWDRLKDTIKDLILRRRQQENETERRKSSSLAEIARRAKERIFNRKRHDDDLPVNLNPNIDLEDDDNGDYDGELELLGRDASYDPSTWQSLQSSEIRVLKSSNVYSYAYEAEPSKIGSGILYVTFLHWAPGMKADEREGPGVTYAYYDFPERKFREFNAAATESAGKAVWDLCRIRGSHYDHQHRYRLIQSTGEYVPRKATRFGFRERTMQASGNSPNARKVAALRRESSGGKFFRKSTLPERVLKRYSTGEPNRGQPNRGEPDRG